MVSTDDNHSSALVGFFSDPLNVGGLYFLKSLRCLALSKDLTYSGSLFRSEPKLVTFKPVRVVLVGLSALP